MISVKKNEHRHCDWRRRCHSGLPPPPAPLPSLRHSSLFTCNISLPLSRSPSPCSGVSGQTGGCGATCLLHSRQWTFLRMCIYSSSPLLPTTLLCSLTQVKWKGEALKWGDEGIQDEELKGGEGWRQVKKQTPFHTSGTCSSAFPVLPR